MTSTTVLPVLHESSVENELDDGDHRAESSVDIGAWGPEPKLFSLSSAEFNDDFVSAEDVDNFDTRPFSPFITITMVEKDMAMQAKNVLDRGDNHQVTGIWKRHSINLWLKYIHKDLFVCFLAQTGSKRNDVETCNDQPSVSVKRTTSDKIMTDGADEAKHVETGDVNDGMQGEFCRNYDSYPRWNEKIMFRILMRRTFNDIKLP